MGYRMVAQHGRFPAGGTALESMNSSIFWTWEDNTCDFRDCVQLKTQIGIFYSLSSLEMWHTMPLKVDHGASAVTYKDILLKYKKPWSNNNN